MVTSSPHPHSLTRSLRMGHKVVVEEGEDGEEGREGKGEGEEEEEEVPIPAGCVVASVTSQSTSPSVA